MKKNLAKKVMLSILAGAMLMSNSVAWAETTVNAKDNTSNTNAWTGIVVNSVDGYGDASGSSTGTIAIGSGASTNNVYAIAIGSKASTDGGFGTVVGAGAKSVGQEASAFGYNAQGSAGQATALGAGAKANYFGSVALGFCSVANEQYVVSVGSGEAGNDYCYRKIVNIEDGRISADSHDAVTGGQLFTELGKKANADKVYTKDEANALLNEKANKADVYSKTDADAKFADKATTLEGYGITDAYTKTEIDGMLGGSNNAAIDGINQRLDKTNTKINKVGAGAAALAALHPLECDPDDKLTFSAGMGNYAGENAAALGAFYRPNEKFMVSLGGTMGNGENMVNLGLSIGLDKPNGLAKLSKRELIQKVNAMEAEMAEMKAMLQAIMAKK